MVMLMMMNISTVPLSVTWSWSVAAHQTTTTMASPTKQARPTYDSVTVSLPPNRSYPIVFAPISRLGEALEKDRIGASASTKRAALVSNTVVGRLRHKEEALKALKEAGWDVSYIEIEDG